MSDLNERSPILRLLRGKNVRATACASLLCGWLAFFVGIIGVTTIWRLLYPG